jgi:epsilon-lactone hydrolase
MASPQLERANEMWRSMFPTDEDAGVDDFRAAYENFLAQFPLADDLKVEEVAAGGVPALWVRIEGAPSERTILYLHGGGYMIGTARGYREMTSRFARAAGAQALVVDYRLAPEHPFPTAVDDATAGYRWLLGQGVAPGQVVVAGDSAGAGLALATLVALRDAGDPLPAAGVLLSPWVDMEASGDSITTKDEVDPIVHKDVLLGMAEAYLAGQDPRAPLASPLHAEMAGLPPLLIQVGTHETLLDDAVRVADRARAAGVDVSLEAVEEMPHVWHVFASFLPEAQDAIERAGEFIQKRTP